MQAFSVKRFSKVIIGASDESGRMTFIVSIRSVYIPRVSQKTHIFSKNFLQPGKQFLHLGLPVLVRPPRLCPLLVHSLSILPIRFLISEHARVSRLRNALLRGSGFREHGLQ